MKADLHAAQASLGKYFDQASKDTQTVEDLLKQVDGASLTVAVPNLNTSLNAVQQFKSRGNDDASRNRLARGPVRDRRGARHRRPF